MVFTAIHLAEPQLLTYKMGMRDKGDITSQESWGKKHSDLVHAAQFFKVAVKHYKYSLKFRIGREW